MRNKTENVINKNKMLLFGKTNIIAKAQVSVIRGNTQATL